MCDDKIMWNFKIAKNVREKMRSKKCVIVLENVRKYFPIVQWKHTEGVTTSVRRITIGFSPSVFEYFHEYKNAILVFAWNTDFGTTFFFHSRIFRQDDISRL